MNSVANRVGYVSHPLWNEQLAFICMNAIAQMPCYFFPVFFTNLVVFFFFLDFAIKPYFHWILGEKLCVFHDYSICTEYNLATAAPAMTPITMHHIQIPCVFIDIAVKSEQFFFLSLLYLTAAVMAVCVFLFAF